MESVGLVVVFFLEYMLKLKALIYGKRWKILRTRSTINQSWAIYGCWIRDRLGNHFVARLEVRVWYTLHRCACGYGRECVCVCYRNTSNTYAKSAAFAMTCENIRELSLCLPCYFASPHAYFTHCSKFTEYVKKFSPKENISTCEKMSAQISSMTKFLNFTQRMVPI